MHTQDSRAALPFSNIVAGLWRLADWQLSVQQRVRWLEQALELGINTFDHADIYGDYRCQQLFGEALATAPQLKSQLRVVSKCGIKLTSPSKPYQLNHYDTSAAYIHQQVDTILKELHIERLDLLLIHRPDALMAPAALADTANELINAGKIARFGVSNHSCSQFTLLDQYIPLATNQVEMSLLNNTVLDNGTLDQCQQVGIRPMLWSPLGGGRLFNGQDPQAQRVRQQASRMAAELGVSIATLAYAWLLRHPSRPLPITGSSRITALAEATAAEQLHLSNEQWYQLWVASRGHDVP